MTQLAKLLVYLESHDGITTLEAMQYLRICRLSERIRELQNKGCVISHDIEHTDNARVVRYRLLKAAPRVSFPPNSQEKMDAHDSMLAVAAPRYKEWIR